MRQGSVQPAVAQSADVASVASVASASNEAAYAWAFAAARAAACVPAADQAEAAEWTLRGWAEVALGCAALGLPGGWSGLDDAVGAAAAAFRGTFGRRLVQLRALGGRPPACYTEQTEQPDPAEPDHAAHELSAQTARACAIVAEFCDALPMDADPPIGPALRADMSGLMRWGEPWRPRRGRRRRDPWSVLPTRIDRQLAWRCWMRLPGPDTREPARVTLIETAPPKPQAPHTAAAALRQRVCHGIHNGAHLDHLSALSVDSHPTTAHSPLEFGAGLLAAESYAMAVEILAAAECAAARRPAEARQLGLGLIERIGRLPGYPGWYDQASNNGLLPSAGRSALADAMAIRIGEFAGLPSLAANYLIGPLRFIAGAADPAYFPADLTDAFRARWDHAAHRFPPAARLFERVRFLRNSEVPSAFSAG